MVQVALPLDTRQGQFGDEAVDSDVETFAAKGDSILRRVRTRTGEVRTSIVSAGVAGALPGAVDAETAEQALLRLRSDPPWPTTSGRVRAVDLFAGCGGLSLGVKEACRALGLDFEVPFAVDFERPATDVYSANFPHSGLVCDDVQNHFDRAVGRELSLVERARARAIGHVDLLIGGPPCQGHSDLNNRTRRVDDKNELYFTMVRAAEVLEPTHVVIENVPGAVRDRGRVVQRSAEALQRLGYKVSFGVVDATGLGVPQRRKRLLLLATIGNAVSPDQISAAHSRRLRTVRWAIDDLQHVEPKYLVDEPARSAPATRTRIDYLYEHDLYDLPNAERPACHAHGNHSYSSIYGRLRWDEPAQTVTTGFYSMCMGRYVHPSQRRTLTAHEAARLQFFPDFFDFSAVTKRGQLAQMIGNAVPMRLAYAAAIELFR